MQKAFPFVQTVASSKKQQVGTTQAPVLWIKTVPRHRSMSAGRQNYTQLKQNNKTSYASWIWDGGYEWVNYHPTQRGTVKWAFCVSEVWTVRCMQNDSSRHLWFVWNLALRGLCPFPVLNPDSLSCTALLTFGTKVSVAGTSPKWVRKPCSAT